MRSHCCRVNRVLATFLEAYSWFGATTMMHVLAWNRLLHFALPSVDRVVFGRVGVRVAIAAWAANATAWMVVLMTPLTHFRWVPNNWFAFFDFSIPNTLGVHYFGKLQNSINFITTPICYALLLIVLYYKRV